MQWASINCQTVGATLVSKSRREPEADIKSPYPDVPEDLRARLLLIKSQSKGGNNAFQPFIAMYFIDLLEIEI